MCSTTGTFLNLDIWVEIVRQYRFSMLDEEGASKAKKAALRSLALVSRRLASLAQSEMWRAVRGIRHVTEYIKDVESSNLIRNVSPMILRQPLQPQVIERVQHMLSCTQNVILDVFAKVNFSDWEFVQMAMGESHLFKNLKFLYINWRVCRAGESGRMILPLLASPSVEDIVHRNVTHEDEAALLLFHSILRMQNASIASVKLSKGSYLSPGIIPRMLHSASPDVFMHIYALWLSHQDHFAAWYLALASSPNLTTLLINESPTNQTCWDYPNEIIRLANLEFLEIRGQSQHVFPLRQLDCPMLISLILRLQSSSGCSDIFSSISHFIRLDKLQVEISNAHSQESPLLQLGDLRPVLNFSSTLCYLRVVGATSLLTEADVSEIFVTRPSLQHLIISGPSSYALHPSILPSVAQHRLRSICLPIDLSSITSLTIPPIGTSDPSLIRFIIPECVSLPESMQDKLQLVEFIYHTFPKAKIASLHVTEMSKSVDDLETMRVSLCKVS